ncbi:hypothetical protein EsH8_XI_000102 [Colletotrichum jinshuiense]
MPSATAAPATRPPSQTASLTLHRDANMTFQHAQRARSSSQSEAHLSSVSGHFALLASRGGLPSPHEQGPAGRDESKQQHAPVAVRRPGPLPPYLIMPLVANDKITYLKASYTPFKSSLPRRHRLHMRQNRGPKLLYPQPQTRG